MPRPIDLSGRIAIVTGAGRGIGLAITERLLDAGCWVAANVRVQSEQIDAAHAPLRERWPAHFIVVEGSAEDPATVKNLLQIVFDRHRRLDILVNNAGILRDNLIGMIPDEEMSLVMDNNVLSVLRLTQAAARLMKRKGAGSIINLASVIGRVGNAGQMVYGASKAAVIGATLSAAKELAPAGIRVNAIAPGLIATQMTASLPEQTRARLTERIGLGRVGTSQEVADVALFLASDMARYVTGQVIGVDGGLII